MVALNPPPFDPKAKASDFLLPATDGKIYSLDQCTGVNGLLVMFICNHCPFVQAIIDNLVKDCKRLQEVGIGIVAISVNDAEQYPEDSFDNMKKFAAKHDFCFPYLYDEAQRVAKQFEAVCTPDFFGYNRELALRYRGRFDESGMKQLPVTKHELLQAMLEIAQNGSYAGKQMPSIGCSIKWK
jgi:peroxiredoxin